MQELIMPNDKKTIGIVGGGQLGRMLTNAAHRLGFKVIVLDPTPNSPGGQVANKQILGSFKDKDKILELAVESDYLTVELEGINEEALFEIIKSGKPVNPDPNILKIIKDKFSQKAFLEKNLIPVANFALINNEEDCIEQGKLFGYPYFLKARFDAYDGRGNVLIKNEAEITTAFAKLSKSPLYAEKFVPFIKELSVVSARDVFGKIVSYPVVETVHKNNICHIVRSPANVSKKVADKAHELAGRTLNKLGGVGVFAVEMFLTKDNEVLVNEIAPRVHNSGHHTIEAFNVSQFEQHIRAIAELPILDIEQISSAVMINILGERSGPVQIKGLESAEKLSGISVHIYGKMETRPERKMGHITVLAGTTDEAEGIALEARESISI
ncbi:MAG: 5-(carboxyamino)imidazole ribonucleotide synthase [Patescibacteria group bacterium]